MAVSRRECFRCGRPQYCSVTVTRALLPTPRTKEKRSVLEKKNGVIEQCTMALPSHVLCFRPKKAVTAHPAACS